MYFRGVLHRIAAAAEIGIAPVAPVGVREISLGRELRGFKDFAESQVSRSGSHSFLHAAVGERGFRSGYGLGAPRGYLYDAELREPAVNHRAGAAYDLDPLHLLGGDAFQLRAAEERFIVALAVDQQEYLSFHAPVASDTEAQGALDVHAEIQPGHQPEHVHEAPGAGIDDLVAGYNGDYPGGLPGGEIQAGGYRGPDIKNVFEGGPFEVEKVQLARGRGKGRSAGQEQSE